MIIDSINNMSRYEGLSEGVVKALSFLQNTDLSRLTQGRHDISGDDVFCLVDEYKTRMPSDGALEMHQKYVDVHAVVSGSEHVGYANLSNQAVIREYDAEHDYALYRGEPEFFTLEPGLFVIFFPDDLHMPGIGLDGTVVTKIVIKARV